MYWYVRGLQLTWYKIICEEKAEQWKQNRAKQARREQSKKKKNNDIMLLNEKVKKSQSSLRRKYHEHSIDAVAAFLVVRCRLLFTSNDNFKTQRLCGCCRCWCCLCAVSYFCFLSPFSVSSFFAFASYNSFYSFLSRSLSYAFFETNTIIIFRSYTRFSFLCSSFYCCCCAQILM